jgi:hypothetical protein
MTGQGNSAKTPTNPLYIQQKSQINKLNQLEQTIKFAKSTQQQQFYPLAISPRISKHFWTYLRNYQLYLNYYIFLMHIFSLRRIFRALHGVKYSTCENCGEPISSTSSLHACNPESIPLSFTYTKLTESLR